MRNLRYALKSALILFAGLLLVASAVHAQEAAPAGVLFENVRIFDGVSSQISPPSSVLVVGNEIEAISEDAIDPPEGMNVTTIEGGGRTLMPGLIDAHWHAMLAAVPLNVLLTADLSYITAVAVREAEATLLRGFTTVRDMSGPVFGLKRAIDEGITPGPRIYPSGTGISQTGGHGDFRPAYEVPAAPDSFTYFERINGSVIADGVPEVLQAVREQLMLGASQIKVMAGGGVSSVYDPIDVAQYTEAELRAAVQAAENWNTYVAVHAYTPEAIQTAIAAGVRSIEHGQLADEETARLMAEKGVWWSLQPFLQDEDAVPQATEAKREKQRQVNEGTANAYRLAKKYDIKTAFGTDVLFSPSLPARQGAMLAKLERWYTPAEALIMATSNNAELLAMSGPRNPYPGQLGVVAEGALADLILVEGNPLQDLDLVADPEKNFVVIIKDGVIYKNSLR